MWKQVDAGFEGSRRRGQNARAWSVRERMVTEHLGREIDRLRQDASLTVTGLAARLGWTRPNTSYLLGGQRSVALAEL